MHSAPPADRVAPDPDRLRAQEDALGVESLEDDTETLPLRADPVLLGHEQVVFSLVVSSPVLGSVTAKHIFSASDSTGGIMRCFCSSVPNRLIGSRLNTGPWIVEAAVMPPPASATACIMIAASVMPRPAPPYASGIATPSQPASAIALWKLAG